VEEVLFKLILGWPSAAVGLLFLIAGIAFNKVSLSVVGAIVATGFCLYASLLFFPFSLVLLLVVVCNWASVIVLSKGGRGLAAVLIAPLLLESLLFGYLAYTQ
jgi:hypothetical protein